MKLIMSRGVVFFEGKFLLLKKGDDSENKGLWELAGGELIEGETPEQTLAREFKEETGLRGDIIIKLPTFERIIDGIENIAYLFLVEADDCSVGLSKEHVDYGWFTIEEIKKLDNVIFKDVLISYLEKVRKYL